MQHTIETPHNRRKTGGKPATTEDNQILLYFGLIKILKTENKNRENRCTGKAVV
jgi:hypothetical protein